MNIHDNETNVDVNLKEYFKSSILRRHPAAWDIIHDYKETVKAFKIINSTFNILLVTFTVIFPPFAGIMKGFLWHLLAGISPVATLVCASQFDTPIKRATSLI